MMAEHTRQVESLCLALAPALHRYGTSADRTEETLSRIAVKFGVFAHFLVTPTSITASIGRGADQRVSLLRVNQGEMHLKKLMHLERLSQDLIAGLVDLTDAETQILVIEGWGRTYTPTLEVLAWAAASAGVARLFYGGWAEMGVAAVIGLLLGTGSLVAAHVPRLTRIWALLAALVSSVVAVLATWVIGPYASDTATLAGIIILVPGMAVTVALTELATGNWVSGTARVCGAGLTFMQLGFGVAAGNRLTNLAWGGAMEAPAEPLAWTQWPALAVAAVAIAVILQAGRQELPFIVMCSLTGLVCLRIGTWVLGVELAPFAAAFGVAVFSHGHARFFRGGVSITQVPALLLLVPGSVGYRSVSALMAQDLRAGAQALFSMGLCATALVAGILVANLVLPDDMTA